MNTVQTLLLVTHVLIGAMIIGLVLLQRGKGAEAGAAFGAGASATVFGAKGSANFLSRSTAILATLFFVTSLGLAYMASQRPVAKSLVEQSRGPETPALQAPAADDGDGLPAVVSELPVPPPATGAGTAPAAPGDGDGAAPPAGP